MTALDPRRPRPGDVLRIGEAASMQFAGAAALTLRVIGVDERQTYEGWIWLTGYALNAAGHAVDRRTIFVRTEGLHPRPS